MQPPSPTQSTEVPEEAVKALAIRRVGAQFGGIYAGEDGWRRFEYERPADCVRYLADARYDLEPAAPALLKRGAEEERKRLKEALLPIIEEALARLDDEEQYRYMRKIERRLNDPGTSPGGERCEACEAPATKGPYPPDGVSFCDECDAALTDNQEAS